MKIKLQPGKYVVAVSGGVDSVVLLDLLSKLSEFDLVVAHFDHGIRSDSQIDRKLVEKLAKKYGRKFYFEEGGLGSKASEDKARTARYKFLRKIKSQVNARAIITAHHQDDLLETAILNMLRGTGRRGLSSLKSTQDLARPLLDFSKEQIIAYAKKNNLQWREDSTNSDTTYLRNYIRHELLPRIPKPKRLALLAQIKRLGRLNEQIDTLLAHQLNKGELDRRWFINLPASVARETMASWLRLNKLSYDAKTLGRLTVAAKTLKPGKKADINQKRYLLIETKYISIV